MMRARKLYHVELFFLEIELRNGSYTLFCAQDIMIAKKTRFYITLLSLFTILIRIKAFYIDKKFYDKIL